MERFVWNDSAILVLWRPAGCGRAGNDSLEFVYNCFIAGSPMETRMETEITLEADLKQTTPAALQTALHDSPGLLYLPAQTLERAQSTTNSSAEERPRLVRGIRQRSDIHSDGGGRSSALTVRSR